MRGGNKWLREIYARMEYSEYIKSARNTEYYMQAVEKAAARMEEELGITGVVLEGYTRIKLMMFIKGMMDVLKENEVQLAAAVAEIERLEAEGARQKESLELSRKVIELYESLTAGHKEANAELQEKLRNLKEEYERQSRENTSESQGKTEDKAREEKTREEKRKALQKRLERNRKHQQELTELLEALDSIVEAESIQGEAEENQDSDSQKTQGQDPDPGMAAGEPAGCDLDEDTTPDTADEKEDQGEETSQPSGGNGETESLDTACDEGANHTETDDTGSGQAETTTGTTESRKTIEEMEAEICHLKEELEKCREQMEEDSYRANRDSTTSSIPPRTNGYGSSKPGTIPVPDSQGCQQDGDGDDSVDIWETEAAAEDAALHDPNKSPNSKPPSGKRGKPLGSGGGGRTIPPTDETRQVKCTPAQCKSCPNHDSCEALKNAKPKGAVRSRYDIEFRRVLTSYQPVQCLCPMKGGEAITGSYPEGLNNWFQFGYNIKTLAVTLNTVGMVSYARAADILKGLLGDDRISAESVNNWVKEAACSLQHTMRYLKAGVYSGHYLHCDESGVHVRGVLHWIHTACNPLFTYMRVDRQRGEKAMDRIGVITDYIGTVISDCWASYWGKGAAHGLCGAHLRRELYALVKFFKRDAGWALNMMELMLEMNQERENWKKEGKTAFTPEVIEAFVERYRNIIEEGLRVHPDSEIKKGKRGRGKKSRGRNLLERLKEHEDEYLLFLRDFKVPFTNNSAEQSFRLLAIKRAVVGSFDTYEGADDFAVIWSYISTAHKRELNSFDAISAALQGRSVEFLFDEEEKAYLEEVLIDLDQKNLERYREDREKDAQQVEAYRQEAEKAAHVAEEMEAKAREAENKAIEAELSATEAEQMVTAQEKMGTCTEELRNQAERAREEARNAREKANNLCSKAAKKAAKAQKAAEKLQQAIAAAAYYARIAAHLMGISEESENSTAAG